MTSAEIQDQKKALRVRAREKIKAITGPVRAQASTLACLHLQHQEIWSRACVVLVYWPLTGEVDLRSMITSGLAAGKKMLLPKYVTERGCYTAAAVVNLDADLVDGQFGIREPASSAVEVPLESVDLVLVPGLAFDLSGARLGRGRGYYDRILANVRGAKCGVAFDEQLEPKLPTEPHDVRLDYLLTPSKFLKTNAH
jgi:5-formyltetrahydrofolate cyclo-ligase